MDEIKITEEQKQDVLKKFKERSNLWLVFFIIGLSGFIPVGIGLFGNSDIAMFSSPTFIFFIIGIIFWTQSEGVIKKIKNDDYIVYKTICIKKSSLGTVSVDNNDVLSKNVKKPLKSIVNNTGGRL